MKCVPAPADAEELLKLHLKRRRLKGAKAEDLVFPFVPAKPQNRRRVPKQAHADADCCSPGATAGSKSC